MSTQQEATTPINPDMYERSPESPVASVVPPPYTSPDQLYSIKSNVNLRCPTPPINVSPDNLRQYYRGGQAPQYRVLSPPTLSAQTTGSGGSSTTNVIGGSSSSTTVTGLSPAAKTSGFVTPVLLVGQVYPTILQIAKAFTVLKVSVSASARIEMYKTAAAQNSDLSRPMTQPVVIGTEHETICDLKLLNPGELAWVCSPEFPGSNADSPQSTAIYTTITNIGAASAVISLTVTYVPTQS